LSFLHSHWCVSADHTAARIMIGYWHDTVVCLSVCLSVTRCTVALRVDAEGLKVVPSCHRRAVPIHFFRHLLCNVFR